MQIPDYSHLELSLYQKFIVRTLPILKSSIFYRKKSIFLRDTLQAIGTLLKSTLGSLGVFH